MDPRLTSTGLPPTSTTSGVEKALRKSPSVLGLPVFGSKSWKSTLRSVFQTVFPVRLSMATTYCRSLPSKCRIKRSL